MKKISMKKKVKIYNDPFFLARVKAYKDIYIPKELRDKYVFVFNADHVNETISIRLYDRV